MMIVSLKFPECYYVLATVLRNLQIFPHVIIMAQRVGALVLILKMRKLRKLERGT